MKTVDEFFGGVPFVAARAPGRVNLLGEHTDYNDGFMLPVATAQSTLVRLAAAPGPESVYYSATLDEEVAFEAAAELPTGFARYIGGCVSMLEEGGARVPPLRVYVESNLPAGAGLSSSAALEVATLRALRRLLAIELDDVTLALLAQQAEVRYAGVNCGVMDQMASSLANETSMLFLDARTLATRLLPLPPDSEIVVVDSGVPRLLAASKYNERRAECEQAAHLLGVASLRDVGAVADVEALPAPLRQRARHVVSENARVLAAAEGVDAARFGALMNASHYSLRDDYEVSIGALDELTELLRAQPGVFGARLTGAGFGGACVALCRRGAGFTAGSAVVARYNANTGGAARLLIPAAASAATLESENA
ncbi:MAG: galK [Massilia sp.]|nr:galK [Massilia sp.]